MCISLLGQMPWILFELFMKPLEPTTCHIGFCNYYISTLVRPSSLPYFRGYFYPNPPCPETGERSRYNRLKRIQIKDKNSISWLRSSRSPTGYDLRLLSPSFCVDNSSLLVNSNYVLLVHFERCHSDQFWKATSKCMFLRSLMIVSQRAGYIFRIYGGAVLSALDLRAIFDEEFTWARLREWFQIAWIQSDLCVS